MAKISQPAQKVTGCPRKAGTWIAVDAVCHFSPEPGTPAVGLLAIAACAARRLRESRRASEIKKKPGVWPVPCYSLQKLPKLFLPNRDKRAYYGTGRSGLTGQSDTDDEPESNPWVLCWTSKMNNRLMFRPNLVDCILEERVAPAIANLAIIILTTNGLTLIEAFPELTVPAQARWVRAARAAEVRPR